MSASQAEGHDADGGAGHDTAAAPDDAHARDDTPAHDEAHPHGEHDEDILGPIDYTAWGAGILGVAIGVLMWWCFVLATRAAAIT